MAAAPRLLADAPEAQEARRSFRVGVLNEAWSASHPISRQERRRRREAPDGAQGQGGADPISGHGAARSQEAGDRGHPRQFEKSPMARKVNASFMKLLAQLVSWDHIAQGAYHQSLKG
jgi:hypothetical protein